MRMINRLTKLAVDRAVKPGRYADGGGLYLEVSTKGKRRSAGIRTWVFRYQIGGKQKGMGLGPLHTVLLSEAREKARKFRQQILDGIDPLDAKRKARIAEKVEAAKALTFKDAAEKFITIHEKSWKNDKHRDQWRSTLEQYAYPVLGSLPVSSIETAHILKVLEPIWNEKRETASRVQGRMKRILDWCKARGYRTGDNPAFWSGHLDKLLPTTRRTKQARHHPALPYSDIPVFMADLRGRNSVSAHALEFLILTAARTTAVIGGRWSEVNLKERIWTVPEARTGTKLAKDHRVPLPDRAVEILEMYWTEDKTGDDFIFPGAEPGEGLSNMALLEMTKGMKYASTTPGKIAVPHGFRSSFKDWASESTNYPDIVSEMALAHVVPDKVQAAYRRGDLFTKRTRLMRDWSRYCAAAPRGVKGAVPIRSEAA